MISFVSMGQMGRLGNQLFQYAYLRSQARRMGVKFYCPEWIGDKIFRLEDQDEREAKPPSSAVSQYTEPPHNCGFNESALNISDNTDVRGYFLSERYFIEPTEVARWYRFKSEIIEPLGKKYQHINLSQAVSLHIRLTDKAKNPAHFSLPADYYKKALAQMDKKRKILLFSDDLDKAKTILAFQHERVTPISGNKPFEDLYLMSQCGDNICSSSTLSWWGAWLNSSPQKKVIVPKEGALRPGCGKTAEQFWIADWIQIPGLHPVFDHYLMKLMKLKISQLKSKISG